MICIGSQGYSVFILLVVWNGELNILCCPPKFKGVFETLVFFIDEAQGGKLVFIWMEYAKNI